MYRTFKGDSRLELITMIARSTTSEQIMYAVKTYIQNKQEKGRKTSQIIPKLEELEQRFSGDEMVCEAFHQARADMGMPRSRVLPPSKNCQGPDIAGSPLTSTNRVTVQSEISLTSSSSSADNREFTETSTSSSIRSIRPRGASNPLPVPPPDNTLRGDGMPRISRRLSEHDEVPIVVPQIPHNLRMRRTSRSRGRSRSRDRGGASVNAFSSGESDDDALRYHTRRTSSLAGRSQGAKRPCGTSGYDTSQGNSAPSASDTVGSTRFAYRRRGSAGNELERPKVYSVISEDGEGMIGSGSSIGHLPLEDVLDDQIRILSPEALPPSRYSYRGIGT